MATGSGNNTVASVYPKEFPWPGGMIGIVAELALEYETLSAKAIAGACPSQKSPSVQSAGTSVLGAVVMQGTKDSRLACKPRSLLKE
jgi:hypothetical protein